MGQRVVVLVAAILAALFGTPSLAATSAPQAVVIAYTYDGSLVSVPATDAVSERGPPLTANNYTTASSPVDLALHGTSTPPFTDVSWTSTTYDSDVSFAQVASGSATIKWPDRAATGELRLASGKSVAAKSGTEIRKVGDVLETVDDVMANPSLLAGRHPALVENILKDTPGWQIERLGRGSQAGRGWVFRQYTESGNPTGLQLRWHPGGGHHGPDPYWRVVGPNGDLGGIIR